MSVHYLEEIVLCFLSLLLLPSRSLFDITQFIRSIFSRRSLIFNSSCINLSDYLACFVRRQSALFIAATQLASTRLIQPHPLSLVVCSFPPLTPANRAYLRCFRSVREDLMEDHREPSLAVSGTDDRESVTGQRPSPSHLARPESPPPSLSQPPALSADDESYSSGIGQTLSAVDELQPDSRYSNSHRLDALQSQFLRPFPYDQPANQLHLQTQSDMATDLGLRYNLSSSSYEWQDQAAPCNDAQRFMTPDEYFFSAYSSNGIDVAEPQLTDDDFDPTFWRQPSQQPNDHPQQAAAPPSQDPSDLSTKLEETALEAADFNFDIAQLSLPTPQLPDVQEAQGIQPAPNFGLNNPSSYLDYYSTFAMPPQHDQSLAGQNDGGYDHSNGQYVPHPEHGIPRPLQYDQSRAGQNDGGYDHPTVQYVPPNPDHAIPHPPQHDQSRAGQDNGVYDYPTVQYVTPIPDHAIPRPPQYDQSRAGQDVGGHDHPNVQDVPDIPHSASAIPCPLQSNQPQVGQDGGEYDYPEVQDVPEHTSGYSPPQQIELLEAPRSATSQPSRPVPIPPKGRGKGKAKEVILPVPVDITQAPSKPRRGRPPKAANASSSNPKPPAKARATKKRALEDDPAENDNPETVGLTSSFSCFSAATGVPRPPKRPRNSAGKKKGAQAGDEAGTKPVDDAVNKGVANTTTTAVSTTGNDSLLASFHANFKFLTNRYKDEFQKLVNDWTILDLIRQKLNSEQKPQGSPNNCETPQNKCHCRKCLYRQLSVLAALAWHHIIHTNAWIHGHSLLAEFRHSDYQPFLSVRCTDGSQAELPHIMNLAGLAQRIGGPLCLFFKKHCFVLDTRTNFRYYWPDHPSSKVWPDYLFAIDCPLELAAMWLPSVLKIAYQDGKDDRYICRSVGYLTAWIRGVIPNDIPMLRRRVLLVQTVFDNNQAYYRSQIYPAIPVPNASTSFQSPYGYQVAPTPSGSNALDPAAAAELALSDLIAAWIQGASAFPYDDGSSLFDPAFTNHE
ncbi:hypothetical protein BDP27DRAFT_1413639 [Rhodocollybia butyracea]|uniref:Uncharacterized protein n=1 Tax=Rhodocollybia butyracea TaxID=206335 RepID=A0A9P5Q914_9AGAR|nr:hypothetical protein BDP27DRAFT_1413639 [Rhodocollybia butyracea]